MADSQTIWQLVQTLIVDGGTPEEICSDHPELLADVRQHWHRLRVVEQQVHALFPSSDATRTRAAHLAPELELPQLPGYELQGVLGYGGMGVVYKAQHLALRRPVALKMVLGGAFASGPDRQRIHREAQAVAGLHHPNIVTVYDVGECDGKPFFTMELVEGGNLAQRLAGTPQPARATAALLATLADAVHAAHQAGIVHRDLKPGNVLIAPDGTPKITDFGLARRFDGDASLTLTGLQVGTPSYMAPEQAAGCAAARDPAVDTYSLGALLYEMLTGRPPFRAATALETQRQVIEDEPAAPSRLNSKVPRDLETICLKCLEKDARRRYGSAAELAQDLRRFERGEAVSARRTSAAMRSWKWARRHPAQAIASVGLVAALAAILGAFLWTLSVRTALAEAVSDDLAEVVRLERASEWRAARNTLERAKTRLGPAGGNARLAARAAAIEAELDLVDRLAALRFERAASRDVEFDRGKWWRTYRGLFVDAGLLVDGDAPEAFAARVARAPARAALVAAMDDMGVCATVSSDLDWLLKATRLADPDPWRDQARDLELWSNPAPLPALARAAPIEQQPVPLLLNVAGRLLESAPAEAEPLLRRIQAAHPSDFWANFALAESLDTRQDADALGYYRAAIALRPEAAVAHVNLAIALSARGRLEEAIEAMRRAVALDPQSWIARCNLAAWLLQLHQPDAALEHARIAAQINHPQQSLAHRIVGRALAQTGHFCEAAESFRRALELSPDDPQLQAFLVRARSQCDAANDPPSQSP